MLVWETAASGEAPLMLTNDEAGVEVAAPDDTEGLIT